VSNPLLELQAMGQSVWYDNIQRKMLLSGELARMIEEDGVRGVTSNPTIFHKAITSSRDYDEAIADLVRRGQSDEKEIFYALAFDDIQMAADRLIPVYKSTGAADGFVSIEVSPHLAYDAEETIAEARRIFSRVGRKNVMIKVPATAEGIPAIETLIAEEINVNVTLLFAIERYEEAANAYISGLEARARKGEPLDAVSSVASFFVSRVDTVVDGRLKERAGRAESDSEKKGLKELAGRAAVANAKLAYRKFKEIFSDPRFTTLKSKGARVQRVLWASTSTKDPQYRDVLYVEELVGPDTVTTLPPVTYDAFKDHGKVKPTLESGVDLAAETITKLGDVGIDIRDVTSYLETDGVKRFADSFDAIISSLAEVKRSLPSR